MEELKKITTSQNRIDLLHASSIDTLEDIIYHYPYKYDEVTEIWPPVEDKCCVEGVIISSPKIFYKGRFSRMTFNVSIKGNDYTVTIFNRHFLRFLSIPEFSLDCAEFHNSSAQFLPYFPPRPDTGSFPRR